VPLWRDNSFVVIGSFLGGFGAGGGAPEGADMVIVKGSKSLGSEWRGGRTVSVC